MKAIKKTVSICLSFAILVVFHINTYASSKITPTSKSEIVSQFSKVSIFEEGETTSIDYDGDGEADFYITCTNVRRTSLRGKTQFVYADIDIKVNILGFPIPAASASMTCRYYADGLDGYIESLYGTATPKGVFSCYFDPYQITNPYSHALFLEISGMGGSWEMMIVGSYNPATETADIGWM